MAGAPRQAGVVAPGRGAASPALPPTRSAGSCRRAPAPSPPPACALRRTPPGRRARSRRCRNRSKAAPRASVSRETMARLLPSPWNGLPARASSPATMRKSKRNSVRSSRSQFPTRPAGGTTSTRRMRPRESISRTARPVMMVLPAPASSASRKRSGSWRSMCSYTAMRWCGSGSMRRDLAGEGRVELVAERQPLGFGDGQHGVRVAGEIQGRRLRSRHAAAACRPARGELLFQLAQLRHCQRAGHGLASLPAQHGERRDVQPLGELLLRPPDALAQIAHVDGIPRRVCVVHGA